MTSAAPTWPDRYLRNPALRRRAEVGFWATVLLVQAVFNAVVTSLDLAGAGRQVLAWEPWLWEVSSVVVVAALIVYWSTWPTLSWLLGLQVLAFAAYVLYRLPSRACRARRWRMPR